MLMWQLIQCLSVIRCQGGESRSHSVPILRGQRVWNLQPDGGSIALGTGPTSRTMVLSTVGSGMGIADSRASV